MNIDGTRFALQFPSDLVERLSLIRVTCVFQEQYLDKCTFFHRFGRFKVAHKNYFSSVNSVIVLVKH